jgi:hypothetical protein
MWQAWDRRKKHTRSDWKKLVKRDNLKKKKPLSLSRTRLERILKKQAGSDYFSAGRSKWRAVVNTVMGLCTA